MGLRVDVGIDAQRHGRCRALRRRDSRNRLEFGFRLHVETQNVFVEGQRDFPRRLADAGKGYARTRHASGAGAAQFAFRDDIHSRAEPRQGFEHGLIRIRLERVADQRRRVGESVAKHLEMPDQRRARIAIEGRADVPREPREIDPFGAHGAIYIVEVMHGAVDAYSRGSSRKG